MPNNFSYINNIPNPPNNPIQDVPNMQTNTNSISSLIAIDHIGFNTNGSGIHQQVTFPNSVSDPGLGDGNGVLYAKLQNGRSWPFWTNGAGQVFQLFGGNVPGFTSFAVDTAYGAPPAGFTQTGGYTLLPGGLILQYGFYGKTGALGASGTIQYPITFNNFFSVTLSLRRASSGNQTITVSSISTSSFNFLSSSSSSDGVNWMAIGN